MTEIDKFFKENWVDNILKIGYNSLLFDAWCKKNNIQKSEYTYLKLKYAELIASGDEKIKVSRLWMF